MMNQQPETRPRASGRPFEHFKIAVRIAEGRDGPAADVLLDADWFSGLVVDEVDFRQAQDDGPAVTQFVFCLAAAAHNLFRRNAVDLFRPWPHELDAAA